MRVYKISDKMFISLKSYWDGKTGKMTNFGFFLDDFEPININLTLNDKRIKLESDIVIKSDFNKEKWIGVNKEFNAIVFRNGDSVKVFLSNKKGKMKDLLYEIKYNRNIHKNLSNIIRFT